MVENIVFTKMVGTGNSFIIVDNRENLLNIDMNELACRLCSFEIGIGADGLILLEKSSVADFKMRIINSDGTEAEMCGNGARCIAYFAFNNGIAKKSLKFETIAGIIEAVVNENVVKAKMVIDKNYKEELYLDVDGNKVQVATIDTGVPHVVICVPDIEDVDVKNLGSSIRYHEVFKPKGTNVNFVQVFDKNNVVVRTYERGVEGETLACGTGVTASALISAIKNLVTSPVSIKTRGNEIITVYFSMKDNNELDFDSVFMEGEVRELFKGTINLKC